MASENETVAEAIDAVRKMIHDCPAIKGGLGEFEYQLKANGAIDRIEAAHRREVAELRGEKIGILRANESLAADNGRLRKEVAELGGALKKAYGTLYSISCSRYGEGLTCTDDIHELVTMARECSDELYANENLRKALEGANHEGK